MGVGGRQGDDPLDADAVLAGGLEDPAQEDGGDGGEGRRAVEDDGGVFAAEFEDRGGEGEGRG